MGGWIGRWWLAGVGKWLEQVAAVKPVIRVTGFIVVSRSVQPSVRVECISEHVY